METPHPKDQESFSSSCQRPSSGPRNMSNQDTKSNEITYPQKTEVATIHKQLSTILSSLGLSLKLEGSKRAESHLRHKGNPQRPLAWKPQEGSAAVRKTEGPGKQQKYKATCQDMGESQSDQLGKGVKPKCLEPDVTEITREEGSQGPKPKARKQGAIEIESEECGDACHQKFQEHAAVRMKTDQSFRAWKRPYPSVQNQESYRSLLDQFKSAKDGNCALALSFHHGGSQRSQTETLKSKVCVKGQSHDVKTTQVLKQHRVVETMEHLSPGTNTKRHPEDNISDLEMFAPEYAKKKRKRHNLEPDLLGEASAQSFRDTGRNGSTTRPSTLADKEKPVPDRQQNKQGDDLQLPAHIEEEVNNALGSGPRDEVLSTAFKLRITRADLQTLISQQWLNDEVINFYMNLLLERNKKQGYATLHTFNTFFYQKLKCSGYQAVKRWTAHVNVFEKELILVPIHRQVHWSLVAIDLRTRSLTYLDSMGQKGNQICQILFQYLQDESKTKRNIDLNPLEWTMKSMGPEEIPQQLNGSDCGIFTCIYADYISRGQPITFNPQQVPVFRKKMVWEILHHQLMG